MEWVDQYPLRSIKSSDNSQFTAANLIACGLLPNLKSPRLDAQNEVADGDLVVWANLGPIFAGKFAAAD